MILFRYIWREIFRNFLASLLVLNGLLLLTRLATLLVQLSSEKLGVRDYFRICGYLAPYFLTFTIPLAALVGVLLGFMRLSQDQEILALQSLGTPFRRLLRPVLCLAALALGLSFMVTIKYLPWSKTAFRDFIFELTERKIACGIPPKTFVNWLPGFSIFVQESRDRGRRFEQIFMVDETDPSRRGLIFASRGNLKIDGSRVIFRLSDGCIHLINRDYSRTEELRFQEYVYRFDLAKFAKKRRHSKGEMGLAELKREALRYPPGHEKRLSYLIEYWKRLAFPWAALVLTLLGAPLGAMMRASGKGAGLVLAGVLFLAYYFLFSAGTNLAQKQILPVPLALNLPNFVLFLIMCLLVRALEKGKVGPAK